MPANLLLIMILFPSLSWGADKGAPGRTVEFYAEEVTIAVENSSVTVTGAYHFRNRTGKKGDYPVVFPFFVDSSSAYPDFIEASSLSPDFKQLAIRRIEGKDAVALKIPLEPETATTWQITFRQKILGNSARYILTSTQAWRQPLEKATYCFIVPAEFENVKVCPEQDSVAFVGDKVEYWAYETRFMPDKDMLVTWSLK